MCGWGYQPFPIAVLIAWLRHTSSRNRTPALATIADRAEKLALTASTTFSETLLRRDLSKLQELALVSQAIPDDWSKILTLASGKGWAPDIVLSLLSAFHAEQVTPLNATKFVANLTIATPAPR